MSRSFGSFKPGAPHLTRRPRGGVAGEVFDLRRDIDAAFGALETEIDFGSIVTIAAATYTLLPTDNGKVLLFTSGSGCAVTVPNTLPTGFSVLLVQDGAGAVSLTAGGTTTFKAPASSVLPLATGEDGASIGLTKLNATRTLVYGALA